MVIKQLGLASVLLTAVWANSATAEEAFFHLPLGDLEITDGSIPPLQEANWGRWWQTRFRPAYAVLEGKGEVYVQNVFDPEQIRGPSETGMLRAIAVRVPQGRNVTGKIYLPKWKGAKWKGAGMQVASFRIPASQAAPKNRAKFYQLKLTHYDNLWRQRIPGGAWFRHEARLARQALGKKQSDGVNQPIARQPQRPRADPLTDTFALFTGGRAMSENLQLDRILRPSTGGEEVVDLSTLQGITIRAIDWQPLVEGLDPELDPLAAKIPADQHAIFFPSFNAAVAMADEMAQQGATILQLAEPRSTSAGTLERYQRQMGLTITAMARLLGPTMAQSVAITGSDPYFRTGTDIAVLFETENAAALEKLLLAQITLAATENMAAKPIQGDVRGLVYRGLRSADRTICSYVAKMDGVVIVTNSPFQLEQLVQVTTGKTPALASLDEYRYFRNRYARGDDDETALLFLSDATIRRWCGPRWRIATSRRLRDAAVIAELQASQFDRLVRGQVQTGPLHTDLPLGDGSEIQLTPAGVVCSTIGSLAFMTPIAEMNIQRVTKPEATAYQRWRENYQRNWRWAFDPIGLRLGINQQRLSADLTVMPLIWASEYREIISYSQGAQFAPDAGDLHDTFAHVIMAINTKSPRLRQQSNILRMLTGNAQIEPLSWLGNNVSIYVDEDPFWQDLAKVNADETSKFMEKEGWRMPIALRADVSSGLKLTLFLAAVRGFIEQAGPGMLNWETETYKDQPYVKITPTERAIGRTEMLENLAIYYSASGTSLTLTLNKKTLQHAIDRKLARTAANKGTADPDANSTDTAGSDAAKLTESKGAAQQPAWLGSNLALQVDQRLLQVLASAGRDQYQRAMQQRAWSNLPILNQWKRRYSDQDPLALHERFWHERLLCPGGGQYVWNDQWQTMESTVYGCPAAPKNGPIAPPLLQAVKRANLGVTFEDQGLRARVKLDR